MARARPRPPGPNAAGPPRTKDETYWTVLNAAIALDIRHGHLRWTMSALARASGVSRPLIYYYFGKSKLGILGEAIALFGGELSGMTSARLTLWERGQIAETFHETRRICARVPALLPFYLLNRGSDTQIGRAIREREAAFRSKVDLFFPSWSEAEREAAFAVFFGVAFAPEIRDEAVSVAVARLLTGA